MTSEQAHEVLRGNLDGALAELLRRGEEDPVLLRLVSDAKEAAFQLRMRAGLVTEAELYSCRE